MPTDEQLDNLERLADGLEKVKEEWPEHFNMEVFVGARNFDGFKETEIVVRSDTKYDEHVSGKLPVDCGTIACAIGWAPYLLGIPLPDRNYYWGDYSMEVFGTTDDEYHDLFLDFDLNTGANAIVEVVDKIREHIAHYRQ